MRGKRLLSAGVLALAVAATTGGPAQAAGAPVKAGAEPPMFYCPAGQKIMGGTYPWGSITPDGAGFQPLVEGGTYRCEDAYTASTQDSITTVQEILTLAKPGDQAMACCPAGTTVRSAIIQGWFHLFHGEASPENYPWTMRAATDQNGYIVAVTNQKWDHHYKNVRVSVTCVH